MAHRVIERVDARYRVRQVPFGNIYEWHPAHVAIESDSGEQRILTATSTTTARCCGTPLGGFIHDLQEREGRPPESIARPWLHVVRERTEKRLRDEAAYSEGSPWRYDVTAENG